MFLNDFNWHSVSIDLRELGKCELEIIAPMILPFFIYASAVLNFDKHQII